MLSSRSRVSEVSAWAFEPRNSSSSPRAIATNRALVITSSPARFIRWSSRSLSTRIVSAILAFCRAAARARRRSPLRDRRGCRRRQPAPSARRAPARSTSVARLDGRGGRAARLSLGRRRGASTGVPASVALGRAAGSARSGPRPLLRRRPGCAARPRRPRPSGTTVNRVSGSISSSCSTGGSVERIRALRGSRFSTSRAFMSASGRLGSKTTVSAIRPGSSNGPAAVRPRPGWRLGRGAAAVRAAGGG